MSRPGRLALGVTDETSNCNDVAAVIADLTLPASHVGSTGEPTMATAQAFPAAVATLLLR